MTGKMLAEWFWVDRWDGSSASLLPMEAQGIYRSLLSQAWRRGARLPNDPEQLQLLIRCRPSEWARSWPMVAPYWRVEGLNLVNDTQVEVYEECLGRKAAKVRGGSIRSANAKRARGKFLPADPPAQPPAGIPAGDQRQNQPPSPSPSPSIRINGTEPPMPENVPELEAEGQAIWAAHTGGTHPYLYRDLAPLSRDRGVKATLDALDRYLTVEMRNEGGKFASTRSFAKNPNRWFKRQQASDGPVLEDAADIIARVKAETGPLMTPEEGAAMRAKFKEGLL